MYDRSLVLFQFSFAYIDSMRTVTGSILLTAAEQAYAHASLVPFPQREAALQVFIPASVMLLALGLVFLVWGIFTEPARIKHPETN